MALFYMVGVVFTLALIANIFFIVPKVEEEIMISQSKEGSDKSFIILKVISWLMLIWVVSALILV